MLLPRDVRLRPDIWGVIVAESGEGGEPDRSAAMSDGRAVRLLLRGARAGVLATQSAGQPFAALVTPAVAPDLSILLLLSSLSEHTRQLQAEPRCALMVQAAPATAANPQTAPRATITGLAELHDVKAARARWLAIHPYGALYAGFGDFALWRIVPRGAQFVGGFARAARPRLADLLGPPQAVAAVEAAEPDIIVHCNNDHASAVRAIVAAAHGAGEWRMVAVDIDGFDAADGERVVRVDWPAPVDGPGGVRAALIRLARIARNA